MVADDIRVIDIERPRLIFPLRRGAMPRGNAGTISGEGGGNGQIRAGWDK